MVGDELTTNAKHRYWTPKRHGRSAPSACPSR